MLNELWEVFRPVAVIVVFLAVAYFAERTFRHTVKDMVQGFFAEVSVLTRGEPSERAINMLFGLLIFIAVLLLIAAIAVSSLFSTVRPRGYLFDVPGDMIILSSIFLLTVFFIMSMAYCKKTDKK